MDDFGLLVGRHFTTLPTLLDTQPSELQLDSLGRLIISGRYLEDSAHVDQDAGIFVMGVRNEGDSATGTVTVVDYTLLALDTFTIDGNVLTEGSEWTAATDNDTTAGSLAGAIDALPGFSAVAVGAVITITADPGLSGNVAISTSDGTNLSLSGAALTGGTDETELTDANGDYTAFSTDKYGRIKTVTDLDVDFDFVYAEDTPHNTGDLLAFVGSIRMDDVDGANSALLAGTEGDYQGFFTNAKGELHVRDNDVYDTLIIIDSVLDNMYTEQLDQGTTLDSIETELQSLTHVEDTQHSSGHVGVMPLGVRNDTNAVLSDTDGDYTPFAVDDRGRLKTLISPEGTEAYTVTDALAAAGDGLESITAAATPWITVASLSVPSGTNAYIYGYQWACDQNAQMRIVTDDTTDTIYYKTDLNSSAKPGTSEQFTEGGRIEIQGAANLEIRMQIKKRATPGGNANGTGSMHIRTFNP